MVKIVNQPPTQERLKEVVEYNQETGEFVWRVSTGPRIKAGDPAGAYKGHGYGRIQIDGVRYNAHRLAWLYVYGYYPSALIDHINMDISDNRISNLREASHSDNLKNKKSRASTATGVKGITLSSSSGKYVVRIRSENRSYYFGSFSSLEEAKKVLYLNRDRIHGEFSNNE